MANITIKDIAKEAGVSKATVSRVLNKPHIVEPETKTRVENVIKKRHYSPSATARNLSRRTSDTIGFVVPEVDNPFFGDILRAVANAIEDFQLTLICCNTDDSMEKDLKALVMLKEQRVRGLLYTPAVDYCSKEEREHLTKILSEMETPVVIMDRHVDIGDFDGVYFDDYQGMFNATKELINQGHTKIAIINATLERVLARTRRDGYIDALKASNIQPEERYNFEGDYGMTKAYELSKKLFDMEDRPTAVITCNNRTTLGFIKALRERKEKVPEDIVYVGLDRIEELDVMGYKMNYIERDGKIMGQKAYELLARRIKCYDEPVQEVILETKLHLHYI